MSTSHPLPLSLLLLCLVLHILMHVYIYGKATYITALVCVSVRTQNLRSKTHCLDVYMKAVYEVVE